MRHVDTVTTLDAPPPGVSRGMATRLVRDKQVGCKLRVGDMLARAGAAETGSRHITAAAAGAVSHSALVYIMHTFTGH